MPCQFHDSGYDLLTCANTVKILGREANVFLGSQVVHIGIHRYWMFSFLP